jgi:hypothetical protein
MLFRKPLTLLCSQLLAAQLLMLQMLLIVYILLLLPCCNALLAVQPCVAHTRTALVSQPMRMAFSPVDYVNMPQRDFNIYVSVVQAL